jgi:hypothetical protein
MLVRTLHYRLVKMISMFSSWHVIRGPVCVSLSYNTPQNVVGYVHAMLEIGPSIVGPWTSVYEDSTIGSGLTTQTACFPCSGANNGWYIRWRIWNYGCEEYHAYPLPIIVYPPAVVTTVNSCIGGGPVTFTKTELRPVEHGQ